MERASNVQKVVDNFAKEAFGVKESEQPDNVCIGCQNTIDLDSLDEMDLREFRISKLCPKCWMLIGDEE